MFNRPINPTDVFPPYPNYAHAVEVSAGSRLLFVSGLNGYHADGATMPPDFENHTELIWSHLETILAAADMSITNLVSLRFYLAEPAHDPANVAHREATTRRSPRGQDSDLRGVAGAGVVGGDRSDRRSLSSNTSPLKRAAVMRCARSGRTLRQR